MRQQKVFLAALVMGIVTGAATAGSVDYLCPDEQSGASGAVVVDGHALVHTGQLLPLDKQGTLIGEGSADAQLAQVIFNLETALAAAGSTTDQLAKLNLYVDSPRTASRVRRMFAKRFPGPVRPALSFVRTPLPHPKALVALDAVAVLPHEAGTTVVRKRCPALVGREQLADVSVLPCGQAVYVSGMAEKGTMAEATAKTLQSLLQTLELQGLDRSHVVQLKAFMNSMPDAEVVREQVVKAFAGSTAPPIILAAWRAKLPIEIELIAFAPPGKLANAAAGTVSYFTPPGVKPSPTYSRVARIHGGKRIYISGLYSEKPGDGQAQVRSVYTTLQQITKEAGTDLRHLVKATYYVSDVDPSNALNKLRLEYYDPQRPPAASKAMVHGVGMADRSLTIDMLAVTPQ